MYPWACAFAITFFICPSTVLGWGWDGYGGTRSLASQMTFCFYSDSWELVVRGSSALLSCLQVGGRAVGLLTMGSLIFGIQKSLVTCFALPCSFYPTQCLGCGWNCGLWGGWLVHLLYLYLEFFFKCCN